MSLVAIRLLFVGDGIFALDFYGAAIVLEFALGMLVATIYLRQKSISPIILGVVVTIAVGFLVASLYSDVLERHDYEDGLRLIYWGVPAAALLLVCVFIERTYGWAKIGVLRHLGDASMCKPRHRKLIYR